MGGQSGMSDAISKARVKAGQQKIKLDGLRGNDILGSTGMASAGQNDDDRNEDSTDIGDIFGDESKSQEGYEFVQQWNPQGQSGMSDAISKARVKAEQQKIKLDGLKGNDILGSTGMESAAKGDDDRNEDSTDIG